MLLVSLVQVHYGIVCIYRWINQMCFKSKTTEKNPNKIDTFVKCEFKQFQVNRSRHFAVIAVWWNKCKRKRKRKHNFKLEIRLRCQMLHLTWYIVNKRFDRQSEQNFQCENRN